MTEIWKLSQILIWCLFHFRCKTSAKLFPLTAPVVTALYHRRKEIPFWRFLETLTNWESTRICAVGADRRWCNAKTAASERKVRQVWGGTTTNAYHSRTVNQSWFLCLHRRNCIQLRLLFKGCRSSRETSFFITVIPPTWFSSPLAFSASIRLQFWIIVRGRVPFPFNLKTRAKILVVLTGIH